MRVLLAKPSEGVHIEEVNNIQSIRDLVGGDLECVHMEGKYMLFCNHDGNHLDLPVNPYFSQGIVKGPLVVVKMNEDGKYCSLSDIDIDYIRNSYLRH